MKNKWILGVIVLAVILGGLYFMGAIPPVEGESANLGVTFYDKDGNQVGFPLGFVGSSGPVESVTITLSYTVTSSSERFEESLEVWGNVLIEWRVGADGTWTTAYDLPVSKSRSATGSWTWDYNLRDIITVDEMGKTNGWEVKITAELTAQTTMKEGEVVTSDPFTDAAFFAVGWETDSLVITGLVGPTDI